MTPVEFYTARLDELEALARLLAEPYMFFEDWAALSPGEIDYVKTLNPAYILADIAAKRVILDWHNWAMERGAAEFVILALIQPFAAHPDFEESWKL